MEESRLIHESTKLEGVLQLRPITDFQDHRGRYLELYNKKAYSDAGIKIKFIQDDVSISKRHVLRGIHGDYKTWKLVTCLYGSIYLIVVDNRPHSSQYRKWQCFEISEVNRLQILIPPGFGNGHLVLTDLAVFHYKQSTYYEPDGQFTIYWNDPKFSFSWPVENPVLSLRDSGFGQ